MASCASINLSSNFFLTGSSIFLENTKGAYFPYAPPVSRTNHPRGPQHMQKSGGRLLEANHAKVRLQYPAPTTHGAHLQYLRRILHICASSISNTRGAYVQGAPRIRGGSPDPSVHAILDAHLCVVRLGYYNT